jgi:hypothetical protein
VHHRSFKFQTTTILFFPSLFLIHFLRLLIQTMAKKQKANGKKNKNKNTSSNSANGNSNNQQPSGNHHEQHGQGGEEEDGFLYIDPARIRFQHSRIRPCFSGCGRSVVGTLDSIRRGEITPDQLPPIQVNGAILYMYTLRIVL